MNQLLNIALAKNYHVIRKEQVYDVHIWPSTSNSQPFNETSLSGLNQQNTQQFQHQNKRETDNDHPTNRYPAIVALLIFSNDNFPLLNKPSFYLVCIRQDDESETGSRESLFWFIWSYFGIYPKEKLDVIIFVSCILHLLNHSPRSGGSPYSNTQGSLRKLWRSSLRVRSGSLFAPILWRVASTFKMQTPSSFRMFNSLVLPNCIRSFWSA